MIWAGIILLFLSIEISPVVFFVGCFGAGVVVGIIREFNKFQC